MVKGSPMTPLFFGWFAADGETWHRAVSANTAGDCFRRLILATRGLGDGASRRFVTRNGDSPEAVFARFEKAEQ
jgi:hypothetical protein